MKNAKKNNNKKENEKNKNKGWKIARYFSGPFSGFLGLLEQSQITKG